MADPMTFTICMKFDCEKRFVSDVRDCKWALLLQTQEGEYKTTKIADMKGFGVVWFYPKGMARMLSKYRMDECSKWSMSCSTD